MTGTRLVHDPGPRLRGHRARARSRSTAPRSPRRRGPTRRSRRPVPTGVAVGPHQLLVTNDSGLDDGERPDLPRPRRWRTPRPCTRSAPASTYSRPIQAAPSTPPASNNATDLVVVYPGQPDLGNDRTNPRGAYYENLIITKRGQAPGRRPRRLQDGTSCPARSSTAAPSVATARWRPTGTRKIERPSTWDGNQSINDGAVVSIYTRNDGGVQRRRSRRRSTASTSAAATSRASRTTSTQIGGGNTGLPANVVTQGGAIFANAYARNLQITNNVVQNNGGAYGTIRIGTPDLPARPEPQRERPHRQQPDHRQRRHQPGRRDRAVRRVRRLRGRRQRHLRQLLGRVRRRHHRLRPEPERHDPPQPDLVQPLVRRGRRHHDRRRPAGRPDDRCRRAAARSTSTTTSSSRTWPTTTAAASAS